MRPWRLASAVAEMGSERWRCGRIHRVNFGRPPFLCVIFRDLRYEGPDSGSGDGSMRVRRVRRERLQRWIWR